MANGDPKAAEGFQITLPWRVVGVLVSLIIVAVVGALGGDTLSYLRYGEARRPNAFTARDGERLEQRMAEIEAAHKLMDLRLDQIEKTDERLDRRLDLLPPDKWKIRIENLEWWVLRQDPEYKVYR